MFFLFQTLGAFLGAAIVFAVYFGMGIQITRAVKNDNIYKPLQNVDRARGRRGSAVHITSRLLQLLSGDDWDY